MAPRGIENNLKAISDAGIRVVAISVDQPEKLASKWSRKLDTPLLFSRIQTLTTPCRLLARAPPFVYGFPLPLPFPPLSGPFAPG
jgi:hypothetical protein